MPYIKPEHRKQLDPAIDDLLLRAEHGDTDFTRYAICRIVIDTAGIKLGVYHGGVSGHDEQIVRVTETMLQMGVTKGDVNYTCCRVLLGLMEPKDGWGYTTLSNAIGIMPEVACVVQKQRTLSREAELVCRDIECELRRRLLDPYEDQMGQLNGDVKEIQLAKGTRD